MSIAGDGAAPADPTVVPDDLARDWAEAWNARDLDAILSHYAEDVIFRSPKAVAVAGRAELTGRAALADYWGRALAGLRELHFSVEDVSWDPVRRVIAIFYLARLNSREEHACEVLWLGPDGRAVRSEVFYGARRS